MDRLFKSRKPGSSRATTRNRGIVGMLPNKWLQRRFRHQPSSLVARPCTCLPYLSLPLLRVQSKRPWVLNERVPNAKRCATTHQEKQYENRSIYASFRERQRCFEGHSWLVSRAFHAGGLQPPSDGGGRAKVVHSRQGRNP